MFKVICKTALKTILGLIIFFVALFAIMSLAIPSAMGDIFEAMGNYTMAASYYSQSYKYTGDIMDISRCCHNSIMAGDDENTIYYCEKYIADEYFKNYAADNSERQYIYGNLACAKYRTGEKEEAYNTAVKAMDGVTGFPVANSFAALSLEVIKAKDAQTAQSLYVKLDDYTPDAKDDGQVRTYDALRNELQKLTVHD